MDQLQPTAPGFIGQLKGKLTKRRFTAATIFVDHHSRLGYVHLQSTLSSQDTVEAKQAFEASCRKHNVTVKHHHTDKGRFADNAFIQDVKSSGQTISYCGVNAHFQNGIAEKRIRDLSKQARKQLLHTQARWPEATNVALWPYALRSASYLLNSLPNAKHGHSPLEVFSATKVSPSLKHHHTFGCPVYALNNALQAGHSILKWKSRARLGLYLGHSPRHSSNIHLVLNLTTGLVSPQFHVQFDDMFDSVNPKHGNPPTHSTWQQLAGLIKTSQKVNLLERVLTSSKSNAASPDPLKILTTMEPTRENENEVRDDESSLATDFQSDEIRDSLEPQSSRGSAPEPNVPRTSVSRYGRVRKLTYKMWQYQRQIVMSAIIAAHKDVDDFDMPMHPIAYLAKNSADTIYYDQAINQPDRDQFIQAIVKEVNDYIDHQHWQLMPRSEVPEDQKVLPSVWSMKRKRDIKTQAV